jgi:hypothetical protein
MWVQVIDQIIFSEILGEIKVLLYCLIYVLSIGKGSHGSNPHTCSIRLQVLDIILRLVMIGNTNWNILTFQYYSKITLH